MLIGQSTNVYMWIDNWIKIPDTESGRKNGRTHGIAVSDAGNIIVFHQANPAILIFNKDGSLLNSWGSRFSGAHGLTLVKEAEKEYLWLTDEFSGEVAEMTLDGQTVMILSKPRYPAYEEGKYSPTWVAVNEERFGGNGDIWVSDGYGLSLVHRFDKSGNYVQTISGEEGQAGRFNCPHSVWIDRRKAEPELYIADRGNKRVQVYDLQGNFKRTFGSGFLNCPCSFLSWNNQLIIPELSAKLTVLDENDNLVCYLGENESTCSIPGWPDHPHEFIKPGKFNSPHAAAFDKDGNIYVVEWVIGGRITKLQRSTELLNIEVEHNSL